MARSGRVTRNRAGNYLAGGYNLGPGAQGLASAKTVAGAQRRVATKRAARRARDPMASVFNTSPRPSAARRKAVRARSGGSSAAMKKAWATRKKRYGPSGRK